MTSPMFGQPSPQRVNSFIFGTHRYQVIAAGIIAKLISGGETYVNKNGLVPTDTDPAHIEHLLSLKLIRKIEGTKS